MGPIPRARWQHGDLSGSCCCSLLSARAVAARLALRPSIIRCIVEHRSAVSMGLVRAICSIIQPLPLPLTWLSTRSMCPASWRAQVSVCTQDRLWSAIAPASRVQRCASRLPFGQVPQCIGVWRLGSWRRSCASRLVPRRPVCCFVSDLANVNQSTNPFSHNHVAAQCVSYAFAATRSAPLHLTTVTSKAVSTVTMI